jgi:hypothetical protein
VINPYICEDVAKSGYNISVQSFYTTFLYLWLNLEKPSNNNKLPIFSNFYYSIFHFPQLKHSKIISFFYILKKKSSYGETFIDKK